MSPIDTPDLKSAARDVHTGVGGSAQRPPSMVAGKKIKVALADDHQMFRQALRVMLERVADIEVVAEAGDGEELLRVVRTQHPDVVCMDLGMPGMNGVETTRQLLAIHPGIRVIGLSALTDQDFVVDMLNAGAVGYVTKAEAADELLRAIRSVFVNRTYLCPRIAATVTDALLHCRTRDARAPRLGARERQVLQLIAEGHTSPTIATRLHLASSTVEVHRRNIMRKLNVHNIAELTKYAIRSGITSS
jgi:two-component system NarL family response regulator